MIANGRKWRERKIEQVSKVWTSFCKNKGAIIDKIKLANVHFKCLPSKQICKDANLMLIFMLMVLNLWIVLIRHLFFKVRKWKQFLQKNLKFRLTLPIRGCQFMASTESTSTYNSRRPETTLPNSSWLGLNAPPHFIPCLRSSLSSPLLQDPHLLPWFIHGSGWHGNSPPFWPSSFGYQALFSCGLSPSIPWGA